jgi:RNA polymerase sigma factor (sigma-70 family)
MLIDQQEVRSLLQRIIQRLVGNTALTEDLMQEAMIHLWRQECKNPGQTQSWYIQSCRFCIIDYLRRGRSVDFGPGYRDQFGVGENALADKCDECVESPFDSASAHDLLAHLSERLSSTQRSILGYLANEFSPVEISEELGISRQSVSKHRQHIARLAIQLGVKRSPSFSPTDSES